MLMTTPGKSDFEDAAETFASIVGGVQVGKQYGTGNSGETQSIRESILCEVMNKNFNKTPTGRIYEEDLKTIYSLMILKLELQENNSSKKFSLSKPHTFTFTVVDALEVLENVDFNIKNSPTTVSLAYKLTNEVSVTSLEKFFEAKLLHYPADRTRTKLKESTQLLQPTPKGVSMVKNFIFKYGIRFTEVPAILKSNLNSMNVFLFERNFLNDKIVYSENLIKILFSKMLGPEPNVWSPTNKVQSFEIDYNLDQAITLDSQLQFERKVFQSPLHHKYFTNPESDSHVQYFVTDTPIRVFKERVVNNDIVKYCVSGKAIVQWLMDSTDILSPKIASEIASSFLSVNLISPLTTSGFVNSNDALYVPTKLGRQVAFWSKRNSAGKILPTKLHAPSKIKNLRLSTVLNDPGLKYLFRLHLANEFCSENINAFVLVQFFIKKITLLSKLLQYIDYISDKSPVNYKAQALKLAHDCWSLVYHIYFTYLSPKSSYVLNIDYKLRSKITEILLEVERSDSEETSELIVKSVLTGATTSPPSSDFKDEADDHSIFSMSIGSGYRNNGPQVLSPREFSFNEVYDLLINFTPTAKELLTHLSRMMEMDSLPKFLSSELFEEYSPILKCTDE